MKSIFEKNCKFVKKRENFKPVKLGGFRTPLERMCYIGFLGSATPKYVAYGWKGKMKRQ